MALHFHPLLLTILTVFFLCSNALLFVPWREIYPKDPRVIDLGKFAVGVHNTEAKPHLHFQTVIKAKSQLAGLKYKLVIEATSGSTSNYYEALFVQRQHAGANYMELVYFKEIDGVELNLAPKTQ